MRLDTKTRQHPCFKLEALSLLLANDSYLFDYLLDNTREGLSASEDDLICMAKAYSGGQQLLIRIAMDIWSLSGDSPLSEILYRLDDVRFEAFLLAMRRLRFQI